MKRLMSGDRTGTSAEPRGSNRVARSVPACRRRWAVLCGLAVGLLPLRAQDTAEALQALDAALHKESAVSDAKSGAKHRAADDEAAKEEDAAGRTAPTAETLMPQLRAALAAGAPQQPQIDSILSQIPVYFKSSAVLAACAKLREDLVSQQTAKEQSQIKRMHDVLDGVAKAVKSARTPANLDDALRKLADAGQQPNYNVSEPLRTAFQQVQAARQFVVYWQDYLAARESGNMPEALQKLQSASNLDVPDIMPRSDILARINELKAGRLRTLPERVAEIVDQTKTLDGMSAGVRALEALEKEAPSYISGGYTSEITSLFSLRRELSTLEGVYNDYRAGLPTTVEPLLTNPPADNSTLPGMLNLRAQLVRLVLARQLGGEGKLQPEPTESIQDYLRRLLDDALARCDARLIMHIRQLQMRINPGVPYPGWSYEKSPGMEALVAAQNQEEAEQYVPAVISYEIALQTGGDQVPAQAIGARLAAIKAAHPADFEKGMQLSLAQLSR
jgi:hypothetical protein